MKHRSTYINTLTSFSFASTRSGWCRRLCASPPSARRTTTSTAWTSPASRARSRRTTSSLPGSSRPRADRERRRRPTTSARARRASARRGGSRNRQSPPDPPTRSLPTQSSRRARRDVRARLPRMFLPFGVGRRVRVPVVRLAREMAAASRRRRRRVGDASRKPNASRRLIFRTRGAEPDAARRRDQPVEPVADATQLLVPPRACAAQRVQRRALPPQRRGERLAGRRVYNRVGVFVFVFFSFVSGGEDRAAGGDGRGRSRDGTRAVTLIVGVREDGGIGEGGIARRRRRGR